MGRALTSAAVKALSLESCPRLLVPLCPREWLLPPAPPVQLLAPLASGLLQQPSAHRSMLPLPTLMSLVQSPAVTQGLLLTGTKL